jgi:lysophospholipase L1-like esterase
MNLIVILYFLILLSPPVMDNYFDTDIRKPFQTGDFSSDKKIKIVAFGNSITATRSTVDQVFAQRLPFLLLEKGIKAEVINSGIPGSHTGSIKDHDLFKIRHGRDRFQSDVLAHNPDVVIIGFGTNDAHIDEASPEGASRIPLADYKRNLEFMIHKLRAKEIKVILLAPNGLKGKYPEYQNDRLKQYVAVVNELSKKYQTGLVNNFDLFSSYKVDGIPSADDLLLDGVHPNEKGHALIADKICKEIIKIAMVEN